MYLTQRLPLKHRELTCKDGGMRAVEHNELHHHLWVLDGKEPRDDPAPVMTHQETSVITWGERERGRKRSRGRDREREREIERERERKG